MLRLTCCMLRVTCCMLLPPCSKRFVYCKAATKCLIKNPYGDKTHLSIFLDGCQCTGNAADVIGVDNKGRKAQPAKRGRRKEVGGRGGGERARGVDANIICKYGDTVTALVISSIMD